MNADGLPRTALVTVARFKDDYFVRLCEYLYKHAIAKATGSACTTETDLNKG